MNIQKADPWADLGDPLAHGRTATVYAWNRGMIVKLFHGWFPLESVEHEARMNRAVQSTGLKVPQVGEIVELGGRIGLEFERVDGVLLSEMMRAKPWAAAEYSKLLAKLHLEIHALDAPQQIPSLTDRIRGVIEATSELQDDLRRRNLEALSHLPRGSKLLHGDLHPQNVLMTDNGPVVIDWIDAARGSPPADVARTSILVRGEASLGGIVQAMKRLGLLWLHHVYWRHYFESQSGDEAQCRRWIPVVAAARLAEGIHELAPWLRAQAMHVPE